jgi:hypothetical protein
MNVVANGVRICHKHKRNNGGYWNLVGPKLEYHVECYDLEGNKGGFKRKEIDTSAKTESWINKSISKSNLSFIIQRLLNALIVVETNKRRRYRNICDHFR